MGLYAVDCNECKRPFMWFSGLPHQLCEKCAKVTKKKEDASTNSLGALPTGRLVNKGQKKKSLTKLINPLKVEGDNMSLAKKYLGLLFEDDSVPAGDDQLPPDAVDPDAPVADDDGDDAPCPEMVALCGEFEAAVADLEDGDAKDKLVALCAKLKEMCGPEEEEPSPEDGELVEPPKED